ncbi:hypothetical protein QE152_g25321 [Popillia japonica]|uniref:Uncharacterized protein n=1 Tax=Popillia japonica TaxID=7064 RepID=A0AAW1K1K9_POPJA
MCGSRKLNGVTIAVCEQCIPSSNLSRPQYVDVKCRSLWELPESHSMFPDVISSLAFRLCVYIRMDSRLQPCVSKCGVEITEITTVTQRRKNGILPNLHRVESRNAMGGVVYCEWDK